jgi:nicotinate-nucleotide adenylyltransferase
VPAVGRLPCPPPPPQRTAARHGRRIGLLGGSFNPAHAGHRYISIEALKRLRLDAVWWLVAPQNPLKPGGELAPLAERTRGARRMARHPRIHVSAIEADLRTRYTVDTIRELNRRNPSICFVWLMGADNMMELPRWRHWPQILNLVPVAILARASYDSGALSGPVAQRFRRARRPEWQAATLACRQPPAWIFLALRRHPASATAIRSHRKGRPGSKGVLTERGPDHTIRKR